MCLRNGPFSIFDFLSLNLSAGPIPSRAKCVDSLNIELQLVYETPNTLLIGFFESPGGCLNHDARVERSVPGIRRSAK